MEEYESLDEFGILIFEVLQVNGYKDFLVFVGRN
jgi:hypothetical protein